MGRRNIVPIALLASALIIGALALVFMPPASAQTTPTTSTETTTAMATDVATSAPSDTETPTAAPSETETATAAPVETATPTTPPSTPTPVSGRERSVTVTGTGTVTATANIAWVYATVEVTGTGATEVLSQTNQVLQNVRSAVTALGVSSDDIQSGGISVSPNIGPGAQQANGYRGSGSLAITVRNTSQAGAVLEAATQAGANRANLTFSVDPNSASLDGAREAAFANARSKAEKLAALAGGTLGEVVTIAETPANPPIPLASRGAAQPATMIDPGTQVLQVSLTITWALQ